MPNLPRATFSVVLLIFQIILLILFASFGDYAPYEDPVVSGSSVSGSGNSLPYFYPMFQDVHVMIFLGFGFLMTFLKKYGYGSVGYNLFIAALILQWATLINAWMGHAFDGVASGKFTVDIKTLITSDFAAAAVLITFGAVLGKVSRLQLIVIGVFEIVFYALNEKILSHKLHITDVGGSMVIHAFGAYFGLAVTRAISNEDTEEENEKEGSSYNSDLFAMIGTIFLWLFWPSFNGILLGPGTQQNRAVINTYFSLSGAVIFTFIVSPLVDKKGRISMVHVQNATLAGGVAVGTVADLILKPYGALAIGISAGLVSTLGYAYLTPLLNRRFKIHDTCGVHNLHGVPALVAAIAGVIASALAKEKNYGSDLYSIWPSRQSFPATNTTAAVVGRTAGAQAGYQMLALIVTLILAIVGGAFTGLVVKLIDPPQKEQLFDDTTFWDVPTEDRLPDYYGETIPINKETGDAIAS